MKHLFKAIMILSLAFLLAGCASEPSPAPAETMEAETYTVTVKTAGGMALPGIDV